MKRSKLLFMILAAVFITGCSKPNTTEKIQTASVEKYLNMKTPTPKLIPIKKKIDILDLVKVSFYANSIPYKQAIMQILEPKKIDVAFDGSLDKYVGNAPVNLSLNNVSLREALNTITGIVGISWEKRKNTIWITPLETKIYNVDFLGVVRSSQSSLGGDVLGGGASRANASASLHGGFSIVSKSNAKKGDRYKVLENNIKNMLSKAGHFTLDQAGGILMVTDKPQYIRRVTDYIDAISKSYNRQVMIEAKIIEVNLSNSWQLGIDWNIIARSINANQQTIDFGNISNPATTFNIRKAGQRFSGIISALSKFGSLKLISEPHLRVMNAQPAILSVGRSVSFIKKIEISTETVSGGTTTTSPTVDISSIFDGIVFGITPFIKNDGKVLIRIVPIKSKLVSLEEKNIDGNLYTLPQVDLRETSTVVSARSGTIVVLGGLISKEKQSSNSGIPFISQIPIAGNAFKQQKNLSNNIELVILLKPVIIK